MAIQHPETRMQEAVANCLFLWERRTGAFTWSHIPNESQRTPQQGAILKRAGMRAGDPDVMLFLKGGLVVIVELKALDGELSKEQRARHATFRTLGYRVEVIRALDAESAVSQFESLLRALGVPAGSSAAGHGLPLFRS